jgi:hypothetical protein
VAATVVHRRHQVRTHHRRAPAARHRPARTHRSKPAAHPASSVVTTHAVVRAVPSHNSGVMLLAGALVLLVLVAASLGLLRIANRLHREIAGSAA